MPVMQLMPSDFIQRAELPPRATCFTMEALTAPVHSVLSATLEAGINRLYDWDFQQQVQRLKQLLHLAHRFILQHRATIIFTPAIIA